MSRLLLHRSSLCMYISNFTSTGFSIGWAHLFLIIFLCMPITICSKLATTHLSQADTDAAFACWVALLIKLSFPLAQSVVVLNDCFSVKDVYVPFAVWLLHPIMYTWSLQTQIQLLATPRSSCYWCALPLRWSMDFARIVEQCHYVVSQCKWDKF